MFCIKCGAQIDDEAKVCPKCGQVTSNEKNIYNPAGMGKRFLNIILDSIIFYIFSVIIILIIARFFKNDPDNSVLKFSGIISIFIFYLLSESIWQKTPGKFITGTKVTTYEGEKPEFTRILGRTLARWIPFESLSFLTRKNPVGWHDRLSKTMVVPADYSAEDVRKIDKSKIEKTRIWIIVICVLLGGFIIVGLLSTIAVISLNSARIKARDTKRISDIRQLKTALEFYFSDTGNYPSSLIPGKKLEHNGKLYFEIPKNPLPNGGECSDNFEYEYKSLNGGKDYELKYCIEGSFEEEESGIKTISSKDI